MLLGLTRMIQLGEVPPSKRTFFRGIDGGSENVALASLGLNSTLIKCARRFDLVQQSRLPPSHSHHYLTDGTFSVMEGWLTGKGFAGCSTLPSLVRYLKERFASASAYKNRRVEFNILLVNFALVKWFGGHINKDKVSRIGDPLCWRHTWVPSSQTVLVQFKYSLSDTHTFERDEWGPWVEEIVPYNDIETGEVKHRKVLRSDPKGIDLMHSYPNIGDDPH